MSRHPKSRKPTLDGPISEFRYRKKFDSRRELRIDPANRPVFKRPLPGKGSASHVTHHYTTIKYRFCSWAWLFMSVAGRTCIGPKSALDSAVFSAVIMKGPRVATLLSARVGAVRPIHHNVSTHHLASSGPCPQAGVAVLTLWACLQARRGFLLWRLASPLF